MKSFVLSTFCLLLLSLAFVSQTSAFCIYNDLSNRSIEVWQQLVNVNANDYIRFHKVIPPGGNACCNYQNIECCMTAIAADEISVDIKVDNEVLYTAPLLCGGWIDVQDEASTDIANISRYYPWGELYTRLPVVQD